MWFSCNRWIKKSNRVANVHFLTILNFDLRYQPHHIEKELKTKWGASITKKIPKGEGELTIVLWWSMQLLLKITWLAKKLFLIFHTCFEIQMIYMFSRGNKSLKGYLKAFSVDNVIKWIAKSWDDISKDSEMKRYRTHKKWRKCQKVLPKNI